MIASGGDKKKGQNRSKTTWVRERERERLMRRRKMEEEEVERRSRCLKLDINDRLEVWEACIFVFQGWMLC